MRARQSNLRRPAALERIQPDPVRPIESDDPGHRPPVTLGRMQLQHIEREAIVKVLEQTR